MTFLEAADRLERNALAIQALVEGVEDAQARWKPGDDDWSLLEVIRHLGDEEQEDFRQRLDYILHRPADDWPPIDPQGWVAERRYNEDDLSTALALFLSERERSLRWLRHLAGSADLDAATVPHPVFGSMKAGDMLHSWLAHDQLHIRQLASLHHAWAAESGKPFSIDYAGEW